MAVNHGGRRRAGNYASLGQQVATKIRTHDQEIHLYQGQREEVTVTL